MRPTTRSPSTRRPVPGARPSSCRRPRRPGCPAAGRDGTRRAADRGEAHRHGEAHRPATVEADVTLPSASASRERLLPVQDDHQRWSSSQDPRWTSGRSAARVQHPECDDRHGPPSFLRYRAMRRRWLGPWACRFDLCNNAPARVQRRIGLSDSVDRIVGPYEVRVLPLRAPGARSVRFPGGDGRRG